MPRRVERTTPEGVDFGWVMQATFVTTIVAGAPLVAVLGALADLPTWGARAAFAVRVGAVVWFVTAVAVYLYARRTGAGGDGEGGAGDTDDADDADDAR